MNRKNLTRLITAVSAVCAVLTFIASAMSGWIIFKLFHYLDTAQKVMPKMGKAAELYIQDNSKQKLQNEKDESNK